MKYIGILGIGALLLSGCSTHMTKVEYEGAGINSQGVTPSNKEVGVSDDRDCHVEGW